jgi:hypothetical protein
MQKTKVIWSVLITSALTTGLFGSAISFTDLNQLNLNFAKPASVEGLGNYDWEDGATFPGWRALYVTNPADPVGNSTVPDLFRATNGFGTSPIGLYWFRPGAASTSGSLGTRHFDGSSGSVGIGGIYFGLPITNDTGLTLTSFNLGYTGTQWREETGDPGTFTVSYSTDATTLITGAWSGIGALDYASSGNHSAGSTLSSALRTVIDPVTVSLAATPLAPGETLWLRWFSVNASGFDQSIGIDDVTFGAIPEPSTGALMIGLAALGWAAGRRKGWL